MQIKLELLAPAKDITVGTAAIDCGADAVYIAGPQFGARVAAGNTVEDIASLCSYAHTFGVKIYATVNTLIREEEMRDVERLLWQYREAGVDALIVQDMNLLRLNLPPMALHASTQAVIRTPQRAAELEKAGFERLILERQLSLEQIKAIRKAVGCELEFFVHGALCMSYSGECYLSEAITGRSANRGCCAQPCRSKYDVLDQDGNVLARGKHILSMKDYRLDGHIEELADAGITSFKIEGRLKNASYVKNVVRHYRSVIDGVITSRQEFGRASFGEEVGGFLANPDLTFNRGYTDCFIDGKRARWNSTDAAKALGEYVGDVKTVSPKEGTIVLFGGTTVANGDGLSFSDGENVVGMRADVVRGNVISVKDASQIKQGMRCFRNMNIRFERELEKNMPRRMIDVTVDYSSSSGKTLFEAMLCDGRKVSLFFKEEAPLAEKPERAREMLRSQIEKSSGQYRFHLGKIETDVIYSYSSAFLNSVRRELAARAASLPLQSMESARPAVTSTVSNVSTVVPGDKLMQSKYCVRYELGLCTRNGCKGGPLFVVNNGKRFKLNFDCKNCEMSVTL